MTDLQPALPGVPEVRNVPYAYCSPADAMTRLQTRWGYTTTALNEGVMMAASMALDEEGPFVGVKLLPEQERSWPRTFKYGWPNIIAAPSPIMVSLAFPGAWALNYEVVVPEQIVDWTCLEALRFVTDDFLKVVTRESVLGANVGYALWDGTPGTTPPVLDRMQAVLLSPFQLREARQSPFLNFGSLG